MDFSDPTIIMLLVLAAGLLILMLIIYVSMKKKADEATKAAETTIRGRTDSLLRLCTIPFLWAIRSELQRENYIEIEQYLHQFVREKGVTHVALIGTDNVVKLASDKKHEGKTFSDLYTEDISGLENMMIYDKTDGRKLILAPVTGINNKLGTIAITYDSKEV